ncbi:molybdopterin-dependent oxidoreductase [Dankookia sp. GCM10030260]|uniref:molybdopterin-dependent oxidoreductase n=1 Tax=Dankookia sp. GCM10030260 TaxID=3273390 RepID=UPI00361665FA
MTDFLKHAVSRRPVAAALAVATCFAFSRRTAAASLALPAERPVLTVSGKIANTNKGDAAQFDRPMLEALGMSGFKTMTPWYPGPVRFDGVRMDRLLETVGASGDRVLAYALNDYTTELPVSDFAAYGVLLALKRDGEYMPVRDKGPLFIVYPFDSRPELKHQRFYSRSAWQLARLDVR